MVDQQRGLTSRCSWIEFGHVMTDGHSVAACRLKRSETRKLMTPDGWAYEGSLSQTFGFVPTGAEEKSLQFLRYENASDVYLNRVTSQEVFVKRSGGDAPRTD